MKIVKLNNTQYDELDYSQKLKNYISRYEKIEVKEDGNVQYSTIETKYFLENNIWNVHDFGEIANFKDTLQRFLNTKNRSRQICFLFNNININLEAKCVMFHKLFSTEWTLGSAVASRNTLFKKLANFINETYPNLEYLADLDINKANIKWIDWLVQNGINVERQENVNGKLYTRKTAEATFLILVYDSITKLFDNRDEWEKDDWNVRNLEKYGIKYKKSGNIHHLKFSNIENKNIRVYVKKYFKTRLLSNNGFTWGTAYGSLRSISLFCEYIAKVEPTWNDFNELSRDIIEDFYLYLNYYAKNNKKRKDSNPESYIQMSIFKIRSFLLDLQRYEYEIAPKKNIQSLIFAQDIPKLKKKSSDNIDYIPDYILEQIVSNFDNLNKEIQPIFLIMLQTGLRISDVLELNQNCLVKLNNKYWIETDIEKTYIKGHRIPINDEIADIVAVLIDEASKNSNEHNNPERLIFVRYEGSRKGKPYLQGWVSQSINNFIRENNITDENGSVFHYKNHALRHTFAVKMLNGGADILTVQELLAHASPEMTMRYAKLLDDTKRKVFDNAIKQGIFSFDESTQLKEENNNEIPNDILDMLWTNHKLNAMDTPYGTCLQRANGRCDFAKQPPCLTCNGGTPCRDLCVGAFEGDIQKYEILINSTKSMIESAKIYNRLDMVKENEEILSLYENIYTKISSGNIVYSRLDRIKKKGDVNV